MGWPSNSEAEERHTAKVDDISWIIANFVPFQETLNYWKQLPHILKYFRADEDPNARLPKNFLSGFLEVIVLFLLKAHSKLTSSPGTQLNACSFSHNFVHIPMQETAVRTPLFPLAVTPMCMPCFSLFPILCIKRFALLDKLVRYHVA